MSETDQIPNVGVTLITVHKIITRALHVSADSARGLGKYNQPERSIYKGFVDYTYCTLIFLDGHHLLEDELVFPYFRPRIRDAPYVELISQHQKIAQLITDARSTLAEIEPNVADLKLLERLRHLLLHIDALWHPHIAQEELHLNPETIARVLTPEERIDTARHFGEYAQQKNQPDFLLVPFTLFNLEISEREKMMAGFPPVITQQLLPVVWKGKWEHMQPYLLN